MGLAGAATWRAFTCDGGCPILADMTEWHGEKHGNRPMSLWDMEVDER